MRIVFAAFVLLVIQVAPLFSQSTSIDTLLKQASLKARNDDVPGASALLLEATKLAEKANNNQQLCEIQILAGKIGLISENDQAAKVAITLAEKYCTVCRDTQNMANALLLKGVLHTKEQQFDSAVYDFKTSAGLFMLRKDTLPSINALAKVGNVLEERGQYAEAQQYYLQFYEFVKNKPESNGFIVANIYLAGNYLYLNQPQKALFHNNFVLEKALQRGDRYEYAQAMRYDAMIFKAMGRYEVAYNKLYKYATYYQDSLMNNEYLMKTEELKAKYENEKKENQLALQQAEITKGNLRFWAVTGGLALAVIAGIFLFLLTRQLRKRNEEKEFLIKEIHHRVKNNLQILSSLLHLQSRQITDSSALDAVREGQNRVDAMGLIHQKLYMGDNLAKVEMKDYLEQFGNNMLDSFGLEDGRVNIVYDLDPLHLDVDTAIPIGLIINELTTNALKYAFPDGRSGVIRISLRKNAQNHLVLNVSDNGAGAGAARDAKNSTSFGTNLVQMLSKKLKGKPVVSSTENGYETNIVFENTESR